MSRPRTRSRCTPVVIALLVPLAVGAPAIDAAAASVTVGGTTSASPSVENRSEDNKSVKNTATENTATEHPTGAWTWPVAEPRVLLAPFNPPEHDFGAGHRGIDVAARPGDPIAAPAAGLVLFAGAVGGRSVVTIDHGGGLVSSFDPALPSVAAGTEVARGTTIGQVEPGAPMHCAEGCLHVGVRMEGRYVDPLPYFGRPVRSVLLPLGS